MENLEKYARCTRLDRTAAESIEIRTLHSLVADLGESQLSTKRELKDDMNNIKTTLHSLWDLLIGRSDQNCENGRGKKNDDVVEVLNISSDSSSLATRSKNNATNTASRRKAKGVMRSPIKLRSPIRTRQYTERRDGRPQVVGLFITTKALSEIDRKLINHVFYPTNNASEVFVKSPWFHLNREEVTVLQPEIPLSTKVITMCVDLLTVLEMHNEKRVNWFLPPAFDVYSATGDRVFAASRKTMKTVYCSEEFNDCEKIFVPVLLDNHIFLCVFDLKKEVIDIWDSLPNYLDSVRRNEKVLQIAKELDSIFLESVFNRFEYSMLSTFTIEEVVNSPRQKNGFDCGVFVLKLLRSGGYMDQSARAMRKKFDSHEERLDLALYLLNHEKNSVRDAIHHKVLMESVDRDDSVDGGSERSQTPE